MRHRWTAASRSTKGLTPPAPSIARSTEGLTPLAPRIARLTEGLTPLAPSIARLTEGLTPLAPRIARSTEGLTPLAPRIARSTEGLTPPAPVTARWTEGLTPPAPVTARSTEGLTPPAPRIARSTEGLTPLAPAIARSTEGLTPPAPRIARSTEGLTPPAPRIARLTEGLTPPAPAVARSTKGLTPLSLLIAVTVVAGCATSKPAAPAALSLLVFGDQGYHLDYLEAEDREPPRTLEEALALEREEWLEDKRPPAEFAPSSLVRLPSTGGYVPASGMMPVAGAMRAYCQTARCDAGVMLGDNVYPNGPTGGADGVDDAKRFDDILLTPFRDFGKLADGFRIYAALGNHDWRTSREAALGEVRYLESTPPFYMDGLFYRVKPPAARGEVELFVLDTEVLLAGTTVYEDVLADDGSELPSTEVEVPEPWTVPQNAQERGMFEWLERSLRESKARWKIVMGHHPLWSSAGSKFEQAKVMRRLILPTLCRYADLYLAGHEHTLELHTDSCAQALPGEKVPPLPQIVSGAAAKHRPLNSWFAAHQARKSPELTTLYSKGIIWGFVHLTLEGDQAVARVLSTPNDGSGGVALEHTQTFDRRSGRLRP